MNKSFAPCRWFLFVVLALLLGLLPGCSSLGGGGSRAIGEIHLFGLPTALTIPGSSVPGGVGVRIYASETGGSQGLVINHGVLEVLMFDQSAVGLDPRKTKPLKVWAFQAGELVAYRSDTMMGTGYQLELKWDQDRPKGKVCTVVARYRPSAKTEIYSTATAIAAGTH